MSGQFPKTVGCSIALLIAAHVVGFLQIVRFTQAENLGVSPWVPYALIAVIYGGFAWLFVLVFRGVYWARLAYTFLAGFSLLASLPHWPELSIPAKAAFLSKALGLVLLYAPASNLWFRGPNYSSKRTAAERLR